LSFGTVPMNIEATITLTDLLAVWGAFVATLVLLWDMYKYLISGPRIIMECLPNYRLTRSPPSPSDSEDHFCITVCNTGERASTITKIGFAWYKNQWNRIVDKRYVTFFAKNPNPYDGYRFPYVLNPGTEWNGFPLQNEVEKNKPQKGILMMLLYLSHRKKPQRVRVVLTENKSD